MPSFTSRRYTSDRFRTVPKPGHIDIDATTDMMEDIMLHNNSPKLPPTTTPTSSLALGPSDGSLLDCFDLPSPPSTPLSHRPTHNGGLGFSSLNSLTPSTAPGLHRSASSRSSSPRSSPSASSSSPAPLGTGPIPTPHWPTAAQRIQHARLPIRRPRSRSVSSTTSSSSSSSSGTFLPGVGDGDGDVEMAGLSPNGSGGGGGGGVGGTTTTTTTSWTAIPTIRSARRTPYYPPNASRNVDRARVYMHRGPHFLPNWTPLSSLPRHVQLQIEEKMVRFTAI
ncbi:hypothetical protein VTK26DRAFT_5655 [Humicola hyalothermophila]